LSIVLLHRFVVIPALVQPSGRVWNELRIVWRVCRVSGSRLDNMISSGAALDGHSKSLLGCQFAGAAGIGSPKLRKANLRLYTLTRPRFFLKNRRF
jgi:uncharacterized protein YjbI with pentapeptide repeats